MMDFELLMISAMYENGGNTTHRFLDGHPEMFVYPFESQLGTRLVQDHLTSMFPLKYRWPVFDTEATPAQIYKAIIDEECRVRVRTPHVSKFRNMPMDLDDDERGELFQKRIEATSRTRPAIVEAFFRATFEAWKDRRSTGKERVYVGYSPIVVVDAGLLLAELPHSHLLHVVRNPWSAYAETKKRPVPLPLQTYIAGWALNQYYALTYRQLFPGRLHLLRYEDLVEDPFKALAPICDAVGVKTESLLLCPSWNGNPLPEMYPWGTIKVADPEVNRRTAKELSTQEIDLVRCWARPYLTAFSYEEFL